MHFCSLLPYLFHIIFLPFFFCSDEGIPYDGGLKNTPRFRRAWILLLLLLPSSVVVNQTRFFVETGVTTERERVKRKTVPWIYIYLQPNNIYTNPRLFIFYADHNLNTQTLSITSLKTNITTTLPSLHLLRETTRTIVE